MVMSILSVSFAFFQTVSDVAQWENHFFCGRHRWTGLFQCHMFEINPKEGLFQGGRQADGLSENSCEKNNSVDLWTCHFTPCLLYQDISTPLVSELQKACLCIRATGSLLEVIKKLQGINESYVHWVTLTICVGYNGVKISLP